MQRLARADYDALGAAGVAAHLRGLVPDGASVADAVEAIVAQVRERGDEALVEYARRFDTGGAEPLALRVAPDALDAAIQTLPLDVVAGLQVAIGNVAEVAQLGVADDGQVILPQGQRIVIRELPVASAAVYVPGGRAPYPSTVVMGVVTARAAGVFDVAVCCAAGTERRHPPGDPRHVPAVRRRHGVPHGRRPGGRRAGPRDRDGAARRRDRRARQPLRPGGQAPGLPSRRHRRLRRTERPARRARAGRRRASGGAGPARPGRARCRQPGGRARRLRRHARRAGGGAARDRRASSAAPGGALRPGVHARPARGDRRGQRVRAGASAAGRPRGRGACAARRLGGLPVRRRLQRDRLRRLRRRLQPRAADRRRRALRLRVCRRAHFRRRMAEVHVGAGAAKLAAAGAPIARAEGFVLHAESMEARAARAPDGALRENGQP